MVKKSLLNLQFPHAGLDRGSSYRDQPPYSAPDCCNVQSEESIEGRQRGGSRPGLGKSFDTRLGDTANRKIRMLAPLTVVRNDGFTVWSDWFQGNDIGDVWGAASWVGYLPSLLPENIASASYTEEVGAVHDGLDIDSSSVYELAIFIVPWDNAHHGSFRIYGRLNGTTPDVTTDGFEAELTMTGSEGHWTGKLTVYNAETPTEYIFTAGSSDLGYAPSGWFKVLISDTDNIKCFWNGNTLVNQDCTFGGNAEHLFGFGMNCTVEDGFCLVDGYRVQYYTDDSNDRSRILTIASANGSLYEEGFIGNLDEVSTNLSLASDRRIDAAQRAQILYIADHGHPLIDTSASVSGTTLTADDISSSTVNAYDCVVEISNVTGATVAGVYTIASVGEGTLTLDSAPGDGNCKTRIERGLKKYDPSTQTLSLLLADTDKGMIPVGCPHICTYRDRLVLAQNHIVYYSRMSDFADWDYGQDPDDIGKAYISTSSEAGQIGDIITALIPFTDDYLIFGCKSSIWVQIGDLADGGSIENITNDTSVVMRGAWTVGPGGSVFFLGPDGIYYMAPGASPVPENISKKRLPRELRDINENTYQIAMAYDNRRNGIHIYLTPETATGRKHFFFSSTYNAFWPVALNADHDPTSIMPTTSFDGASVLLGCRDGYVRNFNEMYETDDGTEISSYVDYGPFNLGSDYESGMLHDIIGVLGQNSGDVTWSVRLGDSSEEAADSTTNFTTGTWSAGRNNNVYVRGYGQSAVLRVSAKSGTMRKWAIERIAAIASKQGMAR